MDFEKQLRKEIELEKIFLEQYRSGLESVKKYRIYRLSEKSKGRYYAVNRRTGKEIYLPKGKMQIVNGLRKQRLCQEGMKTAEQNLKQLERLLHRYRPCDPSAVEERLSPAYRLKLEELEQMREIRQGDGKRFTQSENPHHPEHLKHITSFGLIVRSRIEAAAAELAYGRGWYIMYEKRIVLYDEEGNGHVVYPDFILCTGPDAPEETWIYWEHLGRLDLENYRERTMVKLELFPANGILPGRNLILTTDGMNESIDLMAVSNVLDSINLFGGF